ncbi:hypothetical protein JCM11251_000354 [Rhodosporidiobolus azoricus]
MPFRMPPPVQHSSLSPSPASSSPTIRLPAPPLPPKPLHLTMSVRGRAAAFENGTVRGGWEDNEEDEDNGWATTRKDRSDGRRSGRSEKGKRPGMPRWSVMNNDPSGEEEDHEEEEGGGTFKAKRAKMGGEEDKEQTGSTPFAALGRITRDDEDDERYRTAHPHQPTSASTSEGSGIYRTPVGTLRALNLDRSGTDSMRRASTIKVRGKDGRLSIFFDPTKENPFVPPLPQVEVEDVVKDSDAARAPQNLTSNETIPSSSPSSTPPAPSLAATTADEIDADSFLLPLPSTSSAAIALHDFAGEPSFGELTFRGGVGLRIEVEDLGGGWSLGYIEAEGEEARGLIPRGWYAYVDLPPQPTPSPGLNCTSTSPEPPLHDPTSLRSAPLETVGTVSAVDHLPTSPESAVPPPLPPTPPEPHPLSLTSPPARPVHLPVNVSTAVDASDSPSSRGERSDAPSPALSERLSEPASPYPTRSIGRHVVVSGTEFEPIPGTAAAEEDEPIYSCEAGEAELSVEELLRRKEEEAFRKRRSSRDVGLADADAVQDQETAEEAKQQEEDGLLSLPSTSPSASHSPLTAPAADFRPPSPTVTPAEPLRSPQATGSVLFRLGLTSSPSSTYPSLAFPLSLPLPRPGRLIVPGATILAATGAAPHSPARKKRLPRPEDAVGIGRTRLGAVAGAEGGKEKVLRWVIEGDELDEEVREGGEGVQVWDVEAGPAWKPLLEPFLVHVHSPMKLSPLNQTPYTAYSITTVFATPPVPSFSISTGSAHSGEDPDDKSSLSLTVQRRYSHFQALHSLLSQRFFAPLITIPDLPPRVLGAARFSEGAIEQRRRDLERWVRRLARHPVVGESEELRGFLAFEGEKELLVHLLLSRPASPAPLPLPLFPARVFHPAFNIDITEAKELGQQFEKFCHATEIGGGLKEVDRALWREREARRASANDLRYLAHSLIRLAAGLALPPESLDKPSPNEHATSSAHDSEVVRQQRRAREWGLQNEQGGMGWKEDDGDALSLAKAIQASAEAIASIADTQNAAARSAFLGVQEILHEHSQPLTQYSPLSSLHASLLETYTRLSRLSSSSLSASDALARCETALNLTCAEMERIRFEVNEDVRRAVEGWLDAAVEVQEQTLSHLRYARDHTPLRTPPLSSPVRASALHLKRSLPHQHTRLCRNRRRPRVRWCLPSEAFSVLQQVRKLEDQCRAGRGD